MSLVKMSVEEAEKRSSERVVGLKLAEIGRLRFAIESLFCPKNLTDRELNATFLQDEFRKLWSFPRKASKFDILQPKEFQPIGPAVTRSSLKW